MLPTLLLGRDHSSHGVVHVVGGPRWGAAISRGLDSPAPKSDPNEDAAAILVGETLVAAVADAHWGGVSAWWFAEAIGQPDPFAVTSRRLLEQDERSECAALRVRLRGAELSWTSVGDCRCYVVTEGHSMVINALQHAFLGIGEPLFDRGRIQLPPGSRVVLASDGLPECIYGEETLTAAEVGALARQGTPTEAAEALAREALARGGEDNIALIVLSTAQ